MAEEEFLVTKPIIDQETIVQSIKAAKKSIVLTADVVNLDPVFSSVDKNSDKKDEYLHPVYCNDPRKMHRLLSHRVTIQTKNKKIFTGWVQTVDPVSESFVLVKFDPDGSTSGLTLVPGYNITGIRLHSDEPTPSMVDKINSLFRNKEEQYSKAEVNRRRDALCVWLKDNRVPFTLKEDDSLEFSYATVITLRQFTIHPDGGLLWVEQEDLERRSTLACATSLSVGALLPCYEGASHQLLQVHQVLTIREIVSTTMAEETSQIPSTLNTNEEAEKLVNETNVKAALEKNKGPDAIFKSFKVKDFTSKGDNYSCFVTSVMVDYSLEGRDEVVTYVVKLNPCRSMPAFENFLKFVFEKEARFYTELAPDLNAVLGTLDQHPLRLPRCYYTCLEDLKQVIFLEDMRSKGFKMFDRMKGMDHDHALLVVEELAKLHAASVILEENLGAEEFKTKYNFLGDVFLNKDDPAGQAMFTEMFTGYVRNGARIAEKLKDYETVASALERMAPEALDLLETQVTECDVQFKVVCHGDCWNNNLLFRYDLDGKPVEVCLLDLQINREASLGLDLNYMFFTSLNGDTRKQGLITFLSSYFTSFQTVFAKAKKEMAFTQDELYNEYRKRNTFGLLMALMLLPMVVMDSADVPVFDNLNDENMLEKVEEMKELVLDMIDTSPALRPRMLDMFDEMIEHGIIKT